VTGSTEFTWSGDPLPNAIGRYDIDGEILVLGQRLEITEGFVRFDNVPADDPYLRLRAEREIFGNTGVRRAGALVSGNLSRPTIEPYTDPVTTEERALTLLVTGSDFDIDQGVGAIDFGTYVAPRVFVSYGIGLFEEENVIRVRYDLKRGFGITGSSGGREAGVDLSYRIEN
jgi:translocation and assembly module TamB